MRITTKGRYALRAVMRLLEKQNGKPVSIREIADDETISPEFLEQIFFKLRKAGLIYSVRGPGGGFNLKKKPSDISVAQIFDAVEEGLELTPCSDPETKNEECANRKNCDMHKFWERTGLFIKDYFTKITLAEVDAIIRDREGPRS